MIVSWNWLKRYLDLNMSDEDLAQKLSLSGLNHEWTKPAGDDLAIDLEVTSNRPDCLGHIGVAREIGVLYDLPMEIPNPSPTESGPDINGETSVEVQCPDLCPRYTARLIKGVKVGPSPQWLVDLLKAQSGDPESFRSINNVADITNFVMNECGQPLHAFDFDKLDGGKIIVRNASEKEEFQALVNKEHTHQLKPSMCVIADASRPVALGGIMGGANSEISDQTTNVLIEAAAFLPVSIRNTSRALNLSSDSSYRFERTVDPEMVDWASRRCCELILELCGGTLCSGMIDVGSKPPTPSPITFKLSEIERILGIEIPNEEVTRILKALGNQVEENGSESLAVTPPTWRADLTRPADLVEEVARIHGYDKIPEDNPVPMAVSAPPKADIAFGRVRSAMNACGFSEALSPSLVPPEIAGFYSPWTDNEPLITSQPMSGVLDTKFWSNAGPVHCVRRSLIPSLVELRRINEHRHTRPVNLFEIAKIYLPQGQAFPIEQYMLGVTTGRDFLEAKSMLFSALKTLASDLELSVQPIQDSFFVSGKAVDIVAPNGKVIGKLGEVAAATAKKLKLKKSCVVGEVCLDELVELMVEVPLAVRQSPYPAIQRDLNFIVSTDLYWSHLEKTVKSAGGDLVESVSYRETFVDQKRDGEGKKRILLEMVLRSPNETLTGQQAETVCKNVIDQCQKECSAVLVQ